ncbi:MAG: DUF6607 family protein [Pseudomonadota bacterium]
MLLAGCATTPGGESETVEVVPEYQYQAHAAFSDIAAGTDKADKDRRAILAMRGEYRVSFSFQETVILGAGYERRDDKTTGAYEMVIVVEDSPERIVLQHILVMPSGYVIKHWRQDWFYEAAERFEFVADQTWELVPLAAEKISGHWTQCVYEVSDAPRYCGTGQWDHRHGVSTWTSDQTWRPLPRREYTTRDDYIAVNAENRHTVTPHGWTHEQDNTKTLREGRETAATLVREFGFNDYRAINGFDFGPGYTYWNNTSGFWALVRAEWATRLRAAETLAIATEVDGMPIIQGTFSLADKVSEMTAAEQQAAINALFDEWLRTGEYQPASTAMR